MLVQEIDQEQIREIAENIIACVKTFTKLSAPLASANLARNRLASRELSQCPACIDGEIYGEESVYQDTGEHFLHDANPNGTIDRKLDAWETRLATAVSSYDQDAVHALSASGKTNCWPAARSDRKQWP